MGVSRYFFFSMKTYAVGTHLIESCHVYQEKYQYFLVAKKCLIWGYDVIFVVIFTPKHTLWYSLESPC